MAKVVAAIVTALVGVGVAAATATVIAYVAIAAVSIIAAQKLTKAMTPDLGSAADFAQQGAQGIMVNKTGSNQSIPVIYGATRTGGIRVFAHTEGTVGDYENAHLHLVFAIGEGEMNKCSEIFFDGVSAGTCSSAGSTDPDSWSIASHWSGKVNMYFRPGTDGQSAIGDLTNKASWTDPRFRGIAYAYLRLEYDEDVWKNGLPQVTFNVEGKKVRDPGDLGTVAFSDNPAWCILDYITDNRYGKGIPDDDIDMDSFEDAGDYCDTKNFELRGNVSTNGTLHANVIDMLSSCRGYIAFGNKYKLKIDRPISTTSLAITKENTIGNIDYVLGDKSNIFNKLTAKYLDPATDYKDNIKILESSTLKTEDNGIDLEAEIPMPFVKTASVVEQILREELNQSRQSHMINLKTTVEGIDLQVGDKVTVTNDTFGMTNKEFIVMSTMIEPNSEVSLALREYDSDVYGGSIVTNARADDND